MIPDPKLSQIFGKFAGREVPMIEEKKTYKSKRIGDYEYTHVTLADQNDPTLKEMRETAEKNGMNLRVLWHGMAATCDWDDNRVTINIEKDDDGKWRVSPVFKIG